MKLNAYSSVWGGALAGPLHTDPPMTKWLQKLDVYRECLERISTRS